MKTSNHHVLPFATFIVQIIVLSILWSAQLCAAPLPPTSLPSNLGVNIHFVDKDIRGHIALLKEAGFGWVRKDISWGRVEKEKGVYNFAIYDALINALDEANIRIVLILDYNNTNYDSGLSPYTNIGRRAFTEFALAAAKRYADKNIVWEIYNEPNWHFWKPKPNADDYILLARDVTRALKQVSPPQTIIAPALAGPTINPKLSPKAYAYLDKVMADKTAQQWDGISIHPYRAPRMPESYLDELPALNALRTRHRITTPLIISEWGYHTASKSIDEATQAAYATRSFLIANAQRMPFSIWYNWQETGDDADAVEDNYGIIRYGELDQDDIRKPAFTAIQQLGKTLNGYTFDKALTTRDGTYCLRFKNGRRQAYALWTTNDAPTSYDLTLPNGMWNTLTLLGETQPLESSDTEPTRLLLGAMPLIVTPKQP